MSSESNTQKLELEFRSADDLFQNYSISIIKQVVDKSKATIDAKQQEMRHLVGAKYTDLLLSANTMNDMHNTFSDVSQNINTIMSLIDNTKAPVYIPMNSSVLLPVTSVNQSQMNQTTTENNHETSSEISEETIKDQSIQVIDKNKKNSNSKEELHVEIEEEDTVDVHDFFFPEYLFGLFDTNQYVRLIINILKAQYIFENSKENPGYNYIQWGIISGFPRLVEDGAKQIFLSNEIDFQMKSNCLVALSLYSQDIEKSLNLYIQTIEEYIQTTIKSSVYTSSLLLYVYKPLLLLYNVYIKPDNYLSQKLEQLYSQYSFLPHISLPVKNSIQEVLTSWIYTQLEAIKSYTATYITSVTNIRQLAQLKRDLIHTIEDIESPFSVLCKDILHIDLSLYNYIYKDIFLEYSNKLMKTSYEATQQEIKNTLQQYIYNINTISDSLSLSLFDPLYSLYSDIEDLNILQTDNDDIYKEILNILKNTVSLFTSIYEDISNKQSTDVLLKQFMLLTFLLYLFSEHLNEIINSTSTLHSSLYVYIRHYGLTPIQDMCSTISNTMNIIFSSFIDTCFSIFNSTSSFDNNIDLTYEQDQWDNNKLWLDTHCFWNQYLLQNEDNTIQDSIYIPTQPISSLLSLYVYISKQYQYINNISSNYPKYQNLCRTSISLALSKSLLHLYSSIAHYIQTNIDHPCTYGIIQILFDLYVISNTLFISEDTNNNLKSLFDLLFKFIDPIDWTLSEQYLQNSVKAFISSISILISPLISSSILYTINNTTSSLQTNSSTSFSIDPSLSTKSISSTLEFTFEPIDNLSLYPIPTKPLQMMLQQYVQKAGA